MPTKIEDDAIFLKQTDVERRIVEEIGDAPWFVAHQSDQTDLSSEIFFCALIPANQIANALGTTDWDLHTIDTMPIWWTSHVEDDKLHGYDRHGGDHGAAPLVICREFYGLKPSHREVSEEFRLYHNLYHDAPRKKYVALDRDGNEDDFIRYSDWLIEIRLHALRRFLADKKCYLASFFEIVRYSPLTLEELHLKSEQRVVKSGLTCYAYSIQEANLLCDSHKKSTSCIYGKKLIAPLDKASPPEKRRKEPYHEFIIGQKPDSTPILYTCDPEMLANYFGKNPQAPHYLTPVFFRPEVLQKYYANPEKFSVEDGYLRCGSLWGMRIDNNLLHVVTVFLGDLGRDLSSAERDYWKSFNIQPEGRGISEVNWKRGFLAEFADPTQPALRFKQVFEFFQRLHQEQRGWTVFKPMQQGDEHFFTALRVPLTRDQAEFDSQVLALTKVLVDSLNEKELCRGLKLEAEDKGITKFEKFLSALGVPGFEPHIQFLRNLQDLRSASVAHRKSANFKKVSKEFGLDSKDTITVFEEILRDATAMVEFLHSSLVRPEAESPQA